MSKVIGEFNHRIYYANVPYPVIEAEIAEVVKETYSPPYEIIIDDKFTCIDRDEMEYHVTVIDVSDQCPKPDCGKGIKYDEGKPMMSLVPAAAVREIAKVMTFGASKYAPNNWRLGFEWQRLLDAALRHINSYNDGQRQDPETGLSHLAHAGCMIMFLIEHELKGYGVDNLYKGDYNGQEDVCKGTKDDTCQTEDKPKREHSCCHSSCGNISSDIVEGTGFSVNGARGKCPNCS